MSRYREILALFFLLIFGIFGVHQLTPHHHHSLADGNSKAEHHAAHHAHSHGENADHHHHDTDHQPENEEGGLGCLLHNHTHTGETIDFLLVTSVQKHDLQIKIKVDGFFGQSPDALGVIPILEGRPVGHPPPPIIQQYLLTTSYLRGPPAFS